MKINIKYPAIAEAILAGFAFVTASTMLYANGSFDVLYSEKLLNSLIGLTGAILIFKENKWGKTVSIIWAALQILVVIITIPASTLIFNFQQTVWLNFYIYTSSAMPFEKYGLNVVAIIFLLLFIFAELPANTKNQGLRSLNRFLGE